MEIGIIQFHETSFTTAQDSVSGSIYVAMKPLVEAIGLSWKSQMIKIKSDTRLTLRNIEYKTDGGVQEMISMLLDHLPAYLYSINPKKVRVDLQEKVLSFQFETFGVINSYWKKKSTFQQTNSKKEEFEIELLAFNNSVKMLRVNGASKIKMLRTFHESKNLETSYLPEYSDEEHTFSAKALLEKFEIKISVQQFNKKMISAGFLETKTRKSSKYKTEKDVDGKEVKIPILKEFKSLTEKGLQFRKNMISEKNQLETQPHYFENKFEELLKLLQL
jgi:ribosomal protein L7/L12